MWDECYYLAEVHSAVFPAASVDATVVVLAVVEVSWSRLRRRQQTCSHRKTAFSLNSRKLIRERIICQVAKNYCCQVNEELEKTKRKATDC